MGDKKTRLSSEKKPDHDDTRAKAHRQKPKAEKLKAHGVKLNSTPSPLGPVQSSSSPEHHAAALGDKKLTSPTHWGQLAEVMVELQKQRGNAYVQKMVERLQASSEDEIQEGSLENTVEELKQQKGSGQPIEGETRQEMEQSLGHDFGQVRVHSDSAAHKAADSLNAQAFTMGTDVFLSQKHSGDLSSSSGKGLLAHELTHVVQQSEGNLSLPGDSVKMGQPGDAYETEADDVAENVMQRAGVQRQEEEELQERTAGRELQRQIEEEEEPVQAKAGGDQIQRQDIPEEEEVQEKALGRQLQRQMEEEEEPLQAKASGGSIQRQEELPEEEVQEKAAGGNIQRQEEEELQERTAGRELQRQIEEEEEEPVQARAGGVQVQRQDIPEEEELQERTAGRELQRQTEEEEEEPVQAKAYGDRIQRQEELPEEEVQEKVVGQELQRQEVPEEEELAQARVEGIQVQRQEVPEEEEELAQAKAEGVQVQRQEVPEEEEEPVQAKARGIQVQRQEVSEEEEELVQGKIIGTNIKQRAHFMTDLQQQRSNIYVQKVIRHLKTNEDSGQPLEPRIKSSPKARPSDSYSSEKRINSSEDKLSDDTAHNHSQSAIKDALKPMISGQHSIQRDETRGDVILAKALSNKELLAHETKADKISKSAQALWDKVQKYHKEEKALIESVTKSSEQLVAMYDKAYKYHADTIRKARQELKDREFWMNFALGVAASTAVALTGGVAFEIGALSAAAKATTDALIAGTAATATGAGLSPGMALEAAPKKDVAAESWKKIANLYKNLVNLIPTLNAIKGFQDRADQVASDCNAFRTGGVGKYSATLAALRGAIERLHKRDYKTAFKRMEGALAQDWKNLKALDEQMKTAVKETSPLKMEQDIWVLWIDSQSSDSWQAAMKTGRLRSGPREGGTAALDIDAIEDRLHKIKLLGPDSRLGVDFGKFTTTGDIHAAVSQAREETKVLVRVGEIGVVVDAQPGYPRYDPAYAKAKGMILVIFGGTFNDIAKSKVGPIPAGTKVMIVDVFQEESEHEVYGPTGFYKVKKRAYPLVKPIAKPAPEGIMG